MSTDLLRAADVTAASCGAKAANLSRLAQAGLAVPSFVCVPIAESQRQLVSANPHCSESLLSALAKFLEEQPAGTRFAVRSSASVEDQKDTSFAGQFLTRLNVSASEVADAVVDCWRSVRAPGVLEYCAHEGIDPDQIGVGVVIQEMIEADLSGVVFSTNPLGPDNEAVIVLGHGVGTGVVGGEVPITQCFYNRTDDLYYTESQPQAPALPGELVSDLVAAATLLENNFDQPVDIEFALQDGELWLLQARPITTLPTGSRIILDNSNIQESYPGLTAPLTASFAAVIYQMVFTGLARRLLPSASEVSQRAAILDNMVACVNSRMYYQISNWYALLDYLPFRRRIIPVWQRMLGVREKNAEATAHPSTWHERLTVVMKVLSSLVGVPQAMTRLHAQFESVAADFAATFDADLAIDELRSLYQRVAESLGTVWDVTLLNDLQTFIFTAATEWALKRRGECDPRRAANQLITGGSDLVSLHPLRVLEELDAEVVGDPALKARLGALHNDAETQAYLDSADPFARRLALYIAEFGDRGVGELKLETPTFRSSPFLLVQEILEFTSGRARYINDALSRCESPGATAPIPAQPGPLKISRLTRYFARRARTGIEGRETSRLDRSRIFGMVRSMVTACGHRLAEAGWLAHPEDVFFLTIAEVFSADETAPAAFRELVVQRRTKFESDASLPAYSRLEYSGEIRPHSPSVNTNAGRSSQTTLQGTGCAEGIATGPAVVVRGAVTAETAKGKILVTEVTDPGWVFVLVSAAGVVSEKGSLLSHTAIVARELGVPFVAGARGATALVREGDILRIDGNSGQVEVLEHAEK